MRKPVIHILFWLGFFFIWDRIVYFYIDNPLNRLYFSALDVSLIVAAFYIVFSWLMPIYFKKRKTGFFILALFLMAVVLSALHSFIMWLLLIHNVVPIHFNFSWTFSDLRYNRFFIALLGTLAGCIVKLAMDWVRSSKRIERMEKEKSVAELIYLKAQINPHFLFNSLNSLYAQIEAGSKDSKNTLSALSELLRFQLYDCDTDFIPVRKEIEYLKNYFTLQGIRKDNCTVEFLHDEVPGELMVAPLLLVPFIENAFKYVSDNDTAPNFIKAALKFDGGTLFFYCSNSAIPASSDDERPNKIGLNNVVRRLGLIYGDAYELETGVNDGVYDVYLKIRLK